MKKRIKCRFLLELFDLNDEQQDQLDTAVTESLEVAESKQYHEPWNKYQKSLYFIFEEDMNKDIDEDIDVNSEMLWLMIAIFCQNDVVQGHLLMPSMN